MWSGIKEKQQARESIPQECHHSRIMLQAAHGGIAELPAFFLIPREKRRPQMPDIAPNASAPAPPSEGTSAPRARAVL